MRKPAFCLLVLFTTLSALPSEISRSRRSLEEIPDEHPRGLDLEGARSRRSPDEGAEGGDHNEHLFHGEHLWGLEDHHEGTRKRRSPEEENEEGDHNDHMFHGEHLWGLEDFHEPAGRL